AAVGYYFLAVRKPSQKGAAAASAPVAAAAERQIEQQAEQFQTQGRLDDALAEWRALEALNGPSRAKAEQRISAIEALKQKEQDLFHKGQAAQSARQWKDALQFYQQAAQLKGEMQPQALTAIQTIQRIEQGENVSAIEERTFKSATAALHNKQYSQARNLFEQVVTLNNSGSNLVPQARNEARQIDSILAEQKAAQQQAQEKEQHAFQDATGLLKQGKLPEAKKSFEDVAAMNGTLKGEAQSSIQQIDNLLAAQQNSLGQREQQLFDAASASEKSGQFSDAKSKFAAVVALNGKLRTAAQSQIQQIDHELRQRTELKQLVAQFNDARQQNDGQSLKNLLPLFKDLAAAGGPVASQAQQYAQNLIPREISRIEQAKTPKIQHVAAPAAKKISVTLLQPSAPLRWTRKVQPGHLYSQAYIDGGLKLLQHGGLDAISAKPGGAATVTLQINEKGQVTGGQVLEDTSGAGQNVLAAALQGWRFSAPTVKQVSVTTTATVKVQF
ncbi:MAG TPA: energy transducer TonB, partial [Terriglobia bacterium]|nr:energy transducer TonB [Terriglobia bacterium]